MIESGLTIFAGNSNKQLADEICEYLDVPMGDATIARFPDNEISVKVNIDVRGTDVFVLQSTSPPVNDYLMEMLILVDCLKRSSANRITAVIPYFGYARQDRKDEGRTPISAIDAGYRRALTTIIDANLTTLFAAIILFLFGTGPVQGFAVTLSIGLVTSMFTAIMLTRLMVVFWLRQRRAQVLPI